MSHKITVDYQGRTYTYDGNRWYDTRTYLEPIDSILQKLFGLIEQQLLAQDDAISDPQERLDRAKAARDSGQYDRAEQLVRPLIFSGVGHGALAILCSVLRAKGEPQRALDETFMYDDYPPLLTSRAAALCDLGRWEEAKKALSRALAIAKTHSDKVDAFPVVNRIKAADPICTGGSAHCLPPTLR